MGEIPDSNELYSDKVHKILEIYSNLFIDTEPMYRGHEEAIEKVEMYDEKSRGDNYNYEYTEEELKDYKSVLEELYYVRRAKSEEFLALEKEIIADGKTYLPILQETIFGSSEKPEDFELFAHFAMQITNPEAIPTTLDVLSMATEKDEGSSGFLYHNDKYCINPLSKALFTQMLNGSLYDFQNNYGEIRYLIKKLRVKDTEELDIEGITVSDLKTSRRYPFLYLTLARALYFDKNHETASFLRLQTEDLIRMDSRYKGFHKAFMDSIHSLDGPAEKFYLPTKLLKMPSLENYSHDYFENFWESNGTASSQEEE